MFEKKLNRYLIKELENYIIDIIKLKSINIDVLFKEYEYKIDILIKNEKFSEDEYESIGMISKDKIFRYLCNQNKIKEELEEKIDKYYRKIEKELNQRIEEE